MLDNIFFKHLVNFYFSKSLKTNCYKSVYVKIVKIPVIVITTYPFINHKGMAYSFLV